MGKSAPFDAAAVLDTDEAVRELITAAFETEDPVLIARALGTVVRARNMSKLAKEVGLSRSTLYRALSGKGTPEFATITKVMQALGFKLTPVRARPEPATKQRAKAAARSKHAP